MSGWDWWFKSIGEYMNLTMQNKKMDVICRLFLLITFQFATINFSIAKEQQSVAFSGVDTLVDKAINLVYQKKFDDAIKMCEEVVQTYPDNPMGYLGQAGVYHILMLNYRVSLFDDEFDSLTTLAIKAGEKSVKKQKKDANAYFVLGAAYGFRGLNRIRKSQWLGAFHDGLKGISKIKKAHRLDNQLYDTYYALGQFYYWKSVKAKVLTVLRLMKDEREKGIEYLKIAVEKSRFASLEAKFALMEIHYYEDRYAAALTECETLPAKFSEDPTWNYLMAKILCKLNRWEEAKPYWISLLNLLESSPFKSNSYLAECHYGLANCAYQLQDFETARLELETALQFSKLWDKEKEIEGPLLDFDKVLKRMKKLDEKLAKIQLKPMNNN